MQKILIVRFSSIGDIIQCMSIVEGIKNQYPNSIIHWVTRADMASLISIDKRIDKIWEYNKKSGFRCLLSLFMQLRKEKFTQIYDAHSNIRSNILWMVFKLTFTKGTWVTRYKDRVKRFFLFKLCLNLFDKPFKAFVSFQKPLSKFGVTNFTSNYIGWHFPKEVVEKVRGLIKGPNEPFIALVPSAAWELKRWPVDYWVKLIELLPNRKFIVLGGPADTFCKQMEDIAPDRVINLAGKTSLMESFYSVYCADYVISGDTGFLHAADLFGKPGIAIIGPTAFGFPSGLEMKVMEEQLPCRPCSKDGNTKCKLKEVKKCLIDIKPNQVADVVTKELPIRN